MAEFVAHYHAERNHQGLGNELIESDRSSMAQGGIRRRQRLGGIEFLLSRRVAAECGSFWTVRAVFPQGIEQRTAVARPAVTPFCFPMAGAVPRHLPAPAQHRSASRLPRSRQLQ